MGAAQAAVQEDRHQAKAGLCNRGHRTGLPKAVSASSGAGASAHGVSPLLRLTLPPSRWCCWPWLHCLMLHQRRLLGMRPGWVLAMLTPTQAEGSGG